MTMTFSLHENLNLLDAENALEITPLNAKKRPPQNAGDFYLLSEKTNVPPLKNYVERPRLTGLLTKSLAQYSAMLLTGRTGTGKTSLAVEFSHLYKKIAWLSVESAEIEQGIFYRYFLKSFAKILPAPNEPSGKDAETSDGFLLVEKMLAAADASARNKPVLFVIDDIHNIFDADWFSLFFNRLLFSLTPNIHLLMLSRSNPPFPVWRLRSKQVLGVIDEKLLAFDVEETQRLFAKLGAPIEKAAFARAKTLGRISRLKIFAKEFEV